MNLTIQRGGKRTSDNKLLLYTHQFSFLNTVNLTECDPIFRIPHYSRVSDSVSPNSETDDVVQIKQRLYYSAFQKRPFQKRHTIDFRKIVL